MKIFTNTIILLLLSGYCAFAQDSYTVQRLSYLSDHYQWANDNEATYPDIDGSPYLQETFKEGSVYLKTKIVVPNVPLRYNLYNDEFEFKNKKAILVLDKPQNLERIIIGDSTFIFISKESDNDVSGYVHMWNDAIPSIVSKYQVQFFSKQKGRPYEEAKSDRFERLTDRHYIMLSDHLVLKVTSVKKVIKSLGSHTEELTAFAKKEKVSSGDPEELSRLIDYYHSLIRQIQ